MACACICVNPNWPIRPSRATPGFRRPADERDDGVEVIQRDLQALEDVPARFGLAQLEFGTAVDDLAAELDEVVENLEQRQDLRAAADNGERDDPEGRLQLRVFVEVIEDHLANFAALQVDDDAKTFPIRLVTDVGDPFEDLLADELRDTLDQPGLVDLVGDGVDDDGGPVAFLRDFHLRLRPHDHRSPAGERRLLNALPADDVSTRRKVRPRNELEQLALLLGQCRRRI
jgi:hypothetical protein